MRFILTTALLGYSLLFGTFSQANAQRYQTSFELRERLGYRWNKQLISFSFSAPRNRCRPQHIQVTSNGIKQPFQLIRTTYWTPNNRWIKRATLLLLASLSPEQQKRWSVVCHTTTQRTPSPTDTLRFQQINNQTLSLRTSFLQITTPWYQGHTNHRTSLPAPLQALRVRQNTRWLRVAQGEHIAKPLSATSTWKEAGPLFIELAHTIRYQFATIQHTIKLVAGASKVHWKTKVLRRSQRTKRKPLWQLRLTRPAHLLVFPEAYSNRWMAPYFRRHPRWGKHAMVPLLRMPKGRGITRLIPWRDWFHSRTQTWWRFFANGKTPLFEMTSERPALWRRSASLGTLKNNDITSSKRLPTLMHTRKGTTAIRLFVPRDQQAWSWGTHHRGTTQQLQQLRRAVPYWTPQNPSHPKLYINRQTWKAAPPSMPLAVAKQRALRARNAWSRFNRLRKRLPTPYQQWQLWRKSMAKHSKRALQAVFSNAHPSVGKTAGLHQLLHYQLDYLLKHSPHKRIGNKIGFDLMRETAALLLMYDFTIGEPWLSSRDKRLLRAKMACFAALFASSQTWSSERGYGSGNPNMHFVYNALRGQMAFVLEGHPHTTRWKRIGDAWLQTYLRKLGPKGEPIENSHYMLVSLRAILGYLLPLAQRHNPAVLTSKRWRQHVEYMMRLLTPMDPRFSQNRALGSWERSSNGNRYPIYGLLAKLYQRRDPTLSKQLQYLWKTSGFPSHFHNFMFTGLDALLLDRSLPATPPRWTSWTSSSVTALRSAMGTPNEHYLLSIHRVRQKQLLYGAHLASWFAYGKPISTMFTANFATRARNYPLHSRVLADTNRWIQPINGHVPFRETLRQTKRHTSLTNTQDYIRLCVKSLGLGITVPLASIAKPRIRWPNTHRRAVRPYRWCRQTMYIKSTSATGPHYLVVRDRIWGKQPTRWQMWTLSNGIKAGNRRYQSPLRATSLPRLDQYTALGQHGVHLEYFVSAPRRGKRYTLTYEHKLPKGYNHVKEGLRDKQDLLALTLNGAGSYHVAMFPRKSNQPAPNIRRWGEHVIQLKGSFGHHTTFLSTIPRKVAHGSFRFQGTAGSIQQERHQTILSLAETGSVHWRNIGIKGSDFTAVWRPHKIYVQHASRTATTAWFTSSTPLRAAPASRHIRVRTVRRGLYRVTFPRGTSSYTLLRK
jgi:hypothetical protein